MAKGKAATIEEPVLETVSEPVDSGTPVEEPYGEYGSEPTEVEDADVEPIEVEDADIEPIETGPIATDPVAAIRDLYRVYQSGNTMKARGRLEDMYRNFCGGDAA